MNLKVKTLFYFYFPSQQEVVPSYLATSPIMSDGGKSSGPPVLTLGSSGSNGEPGGGMMKKRRKRRRKARADNVRREESGEYSGDEDMFTIDISSDECAEMESNRWGRDSSAILTKPQPPPYLS